MNACSNAPLLRLTDDAYLDPFRSSLKARREAVLDAEKHCLANGGSLRDFASGHEFYGLHREASGWIFREWAPNATAIHLIGDMTGWAQSDGFALQRLNDHGDWELRLGSGSLSHGDLYRLHVQWPGGEGDRIPSYARRVVQDATTHIFNAQVWDPVPYSWRHPFIVDRTRALTIYEAHVGMAQEEGRVGTYEDFRRHVLPRVVDGGYNTLQLMAVMEHPYYGSFGYQVGSFFAASSRFGTPEELKELIDAAHGEGLAVIMDLVHSHAVRNEVEGLSLFDGTPYQYFHQGGRGEHPAWNSRCFDYGKQEVRHFLLSNCRYWLDEFRFDGYRFDGVTSMLYHNHGLGVAFTDYAMYFDDGVDADALTYLGLANRLIHDVRSDAVTIAEDMSGMPGLAAPLEDGGTGFDYRLAMGIPDCWFELLAKKRDEDWHMDGLFHELTNRRRDERTISYAECHDQALVGGKTVIFELMDSVMYSHMRVGDEHLDADRGMALHKMIRLTTFATAGHGYLNFMGNEFGHPEWIDFPREGNAWSYHYARRQWSLADNPELKYHGLQVFDHAMLALHREYGLLNLPAPELKQVHEDDKVIAFTRGAFVFVFNFHPDTSRSDYEVLVPHGAYAHALDTDEKRFGGHGRIETGQAYGSQAPSGGAEDNGSIRVYIPCRTALVLRAKK